MSDKEQKTWSFLLFVGGPADGKRISVDDAMQEYQFFNPDQDNPTQCAVVIYRRAIFYGSDNKTRLYVMAVDSMTPIGVLHELITGYKQPI